MTGRPCAGLSLLRLLVTVGSLVLLSAAAHAEMTTGYYTGTGVDSLVIDGVGFQPDVVIVKGDDSKCAVIRTSTMTGDNSKTMTEDTALLDDMIQSLDSDGFTVGTDDRVNKSSKDYYWAAFKAESGVMKVDTYLGDGTQGRDVTGVGFTPNLVFVISSSNKKPYHRSDASTSAFDFKNGGAKTDLITAILSDGFEVHDKDEVNKSGVTYHYVCWNEIAGSQRFDSYLGDKVDGREVTGLGLVPEYVVVKSVDEAREMLQHPSSLGDTLDSSLYFTNIASVDNRIQALLPEAFEIGDNDEVNKSGKNYLYWAWGTPPPAPDISMVKSSQTQSDPVNGTTNPKAIPGAHVLYTIVTTNQGDGETDSDSVVITDPIATAADLFVGDIDGPGSGPVLFQDGSTSSGLTYTFTSLSSTTDDVDFSDDGGSTYTYVPVPDGDGFDEDVTDILINPKGAFDASDGANHPSFTLKFKLRVQ